MDINAGTYEAQVTDYGIGSTKDGAPQVLVTFAVKKNENETVTMTWFGSLKEGKAREITMGSLKTLGFADGKPLRDLIAGPGGGALAADLVVPVTVEMNTYNGRTSPRLSWIGSGGGGKKLEGNDALAALAKLGLDSGEPQKLSEVPF